jgi:predicted alpha-1,2-mannosidase
MVFRRMRAFAALLIAVVPALSASVRPVDAVNPLIGTAGEGQTYPAAGVPFGMTQWTPQTRSGETKCIAPYYEKDTRIQGFRGSHFLSGSCVQDYGSVTIMPVAGDLKLAPEDRASGFSRATEHAHPYRYDVMLADYGIHASITATSRAGIMEFEFPRGAGSWIVLEANARAGEGEIHIDVQRREVSGVNPVHRLYAGAGQSAGFNGYFVARFNRPFRSYGVWSGSERRDGATDQSGTHGAPGAYLSFDTGGQPVLVKVGTSFVSIDQARRNLDAEIATWDFEAISGAAAEAWNRALSQIDVSGSDESRRRVFYTALYHSLLLPRTFSDVDGKYPAFAGGGSIQSANGFTYYCDFSLWDTFRSLHPLLTIIEPQRTSELMQSLVAKGREGGWMPIFPAWNSYTQEMVGDHAVAVIADAYLKGIRGFNIEQAYRLMRRNATETPASFAEYVDGRGRRALGSYLKHGFIPLEDPVREAFHKGEQVSRTLEYAYDDFVLSQLANALGNKDDAAMFRSRAMNYRNVIDPSTGFARGRHENGAWDAPFDPTREYPYITEGLPFQYTFFVPQDIAGLINMIGGRDAFTRKLDELFDGGYYNHGNEPSHHIAYLYDFAGAPWKTQERVHRIMTDRYRDAPAGLAGNEDGGQMSAWYVLSAIGLYQVTPGVPVYEIGSPAFDSATVRVPNGKQFTIRAPGASSGKFYIQSAKLNGKPLARPWIKHADIVAGGDLTLVMGTTPNKQWGAAPDDAPPSMSDAGDVR